MFSSNATQVSSDANFIEDVFSTYIYTGVGTNTWNNGIDLSTKGGAVWVKCRSQAYDNVLFDTVRGASKQLITNTTGAETTTNGVNAFTTTGFSTGSFNNETSLGGEKYASWTFREQPKFFDIVTYTGDGTNRTIAHNLGSVPGCIIVKKTSGADNWFVQHRSLGATKYIALNDPDIAYTNSQLWNNTEPTSTVFTLGTNSGVNQSGSTYVAYLFAHNAGGFGLTGTDNVISCGTFNSDANGEATVNLGYEVQWLLYKPSNTTGDWQTLDVMRGMNRTNRARLYPNLSNAESTVSAPIYPTATGFEAKGGFPLLESATYIYIAIRRGPMRVPTDATKVFAPVISTSVASGTSAVTTNFPVDLSICAQTTKLAGNVNFDSAIAFNRSTGNGGNLKTALTNSEGNTSNGVLFDSSTSCNLQYWGFNQNVSGWPQVSWNFKRAPGFFDKVCYTNTGASQQVAFTTLGTTPELVIYKARNTTTDWYVLGKTGSLYQGLKLNTTAASAFSDTASNLGITSTYFDPVYGWGGPSSFQYVAYFFATCPGVSKVGSYTGTAALLTVNCGFTSGARFVLIKRTDSTGDWYAYDSARGISSGSDPYLLLNSTAAETLGTNYVDTDTTGFKVTAAAPAGLNANGGTYIFLAIA